MADNDRHWGPHIGPARYPEEYMRELETSIQQLVNRLGPAINVDDLYHRWPHEEIDGEMFLMVVNHAFIRYWTDVFGPRMEARGVNPRRYHKWEQVKEMRELVAELFDVEDDTNPSVSGVASRLVIFENFIRSEPVKG